MGTPAVVFYISGHGFGHSVRQIEIINALQRLAPGAVRIAIRTDAPQWLFSRTLRGQVDFLPGRTDTGLVQIDGLRFDRRETMARAIAFHDSLAERARTEGRLLRGREAALVIADAPPLACAAAADAGIPAAVCSNFTWDWIYAAYVDGDGDGARLVAALGEAYSRAAGWRLPFHGGFEGMAGVVDVPLVARHSRRDLTREEVRRALGLPPGLPLALVSFGGYGVRDLPLDRLDCLDTWGVVLTTREPSSGLPRGLWPVAEDRLYGSGLRYQDLVRAVDVVLTKPGYGIVSDCIASDTAVLYTSRGRFAEYDVLVAHLPRYLRCRFLPKAQFLAGRWVEGLTGAYEAAPPPERLATNGADIVAGMILKAVGIAPPSDG